MDSPVGALLLAATERGLVRVGFAVEGHDTVLTELAARVSPRVLAVRGRLGHVARELEEYFAGRRTRFPPAAGRPTGQRVPPRGDPVPAGDRLRPHRQLR